MRCVVPTIEDENATFPVLIHMHGGGTLSIHMALKLRSFDGLDLSIQDSCSAISTWTTIPSVVLPWT